MQLFLRNTFRTVDVIHILLNNTIIASNSTVVVIAFVSTSISESLLLLGWRVVDS